VTVKTASFLALAALFLAAGAAASIPVAVDPDRAAAGETITVSGPLGDVVLESLDAAVAPVALGRIGAGGALHVKVPQVPRGRYRVVIAGSSEAPVLEVVALGQQTSVALIVFGFIFVLVMLVGGMVFHRRWRDAIS
jgi:hypothetical protein